jgi:pimeloyl-ACP methyl ester carboxylesterase
MAFISPWGFELSEIKVPVLLYQGSEDLMVPYSHGKWLAKHLPKKGLSVNLLEGEGHLSIFVGRVSTSHSWRTFHFHTDIYSRRKP